MTGRIYADHARAYWAAGWRGILPLPARRKFPPPTDWTGHTAPYPSWPDVQAWTDGDEGAGNLALRLPPDVLGLDIDNYNGKTGAGTIAELAAQY